MDFKDLLKEYMDRIGITKRELARRSGLSPSTISRYCSGFRSPNFVSERVDRLLGAVAELAEERGVVGIDQASLHREAARIMHDKTASERFRSNLNYLIEHLNVRILDYSRFLRYDPSYISRIRGGQRHPARMEEFASDSAAFFLSLDMDSEQHQILSEMLGVSSEELDTPQGREALAHWLLYAERDQG